MRTLPAWLGPWKGLLLPLALLASLFGGAAHAGSLRFGESRPTAYEFGDLARLPPEFGAAEFTLELWVRPDPGYPVGPTFRASYAQLRNWSEADPQPYSSDGWWLAGNWLIDGHSRPRGFGPGDSREGTFSLQFYGGGRLRWMFADAAEDAPRGMVWAVQAWPASTVPSLLDGRWHHVAAVRRWREPSGATLELWIDGRRIATTEVPRRTDMRRFWSEPAHPQDPKELGGWALGAEVMTAWNYQFTQYEDYKGLLDDLTFWGRALDPAEIVAAAGGEEVRPDRRLARLSFDGRAGTQRDGGAQLVLRNWSGRNFSPEDRPRRAPARR